MRYNALVITAASQARSRHCIRCGYRVDNIPSRACPECGLGFDPAHLIETTSAHRRLSRIESWALKARQEKWLWKVVLGASVFALFMSVSTLGSVLLPTFALSLLYLPVAVYYLPRKALRMRAIRRHSYPTEWASEDRRILRKCRRMMLITLGLILLRVPFLICYYLSLPALERAGEYEWAVRPALDRRPSWILVGLMPIRVVYVAVEQPRIVFETPTGHELIYKPDGDSHFDRATWLELWERDCEYLHQLIYGKLNRARGCG